MAVCTQIHTLLSPPCHISYTVSGGVSRLKLLGSSYMHNLLCNVELY